MKVLEVATEHAVPIKILFEVLKDMLPEANIEFIKKTSSDKATVNEIPDEGVKPKKSKKTKKEKENELEQEKLNAKKSKSKKEKDKKEKDKKKKKSKDESDEEDEEKQSGDDDDDDERVDEEDEEDEDVVEDTELEGSKKDSKKDKGGIRLTAVDLTKTVLINLKLDASEFTTFKCKKKKITLGVNLGYFHKLLKTMDKDDHLTLYQDHDNTNFLNIKINNNETPKETEYDLKLLELKKEKLIIPDISFEAVVTINATEFHKICREMKSIADYVEIKCLKNKVIFTCKGDIANRKTVYKTDGIDNKVSIQHSIKDNNKPFVVQGIYELRNLVMFAKCAGLCNDIEIYLKSDYALVIKYTVATLGRLLLCLSPVKSDTIRNNKYEDDEFYSDDDIAVK
jgi:proliferating cell nuclear antigen